MSLSGKTLFITGASRGIGLAIGTRAARDGANTGRFFLDDEVLWAEGVSDFQGYACKPAEELAADLFVDPTAPAPPGVRIG